MAEPTTEAGKRLFRGLYQATPDDIARIEAEAARAALRAALDGLVEDWAMIRPALPRYPVGPNTEALLAAASRIEAVLAIVNPEADHA